MTKVKIIGSELYSDSLAKIGFIKGNALYDSGSRKVFVFKGVNIINQAGKKIISVYGDDIEDSSGKKIGSVGKIKKYISGVSKDVINPIVAVAIWLAFIDERKFSKT